jgi:hypothetical protein
VMYVYDSRYRLRILRACPAQVWKSLGTRTDAGFESGCKGDFIPLSCSPSLWRSTSHARYRIAAACEGEPVEFVSGPVRVPDK